MCIIYRFDGVPIIFLCFTTRLSSWYSIFLPKDFQRRAFNRRRNHYPDTILYLCGGTNICKMKLHYNAHNISRIEKNHKKKKQNLSAAIETIFLPRKYSAINNRKRVVAYILVNLLEMFLCIYCLTKTRKLLEAKSKLIYTKVRGWH